MGNEKRKHKRIDLNQKLVKITGESSQLAFGSLVDISDEGVGIWIRNSELTNSIVSQPFQLKVNNYNNNAEEVTLSVTKVWEKPIINKKFKRIGCCFNSISDETRNKMYSALLKQ